MVGYGDLVRTKCSGTPVFDVPLRLSKKQKRWKKSQYEKIVVDPSDWGESEAIRYEQQLAENRAREESLIAIGSSSSTQTTINNDGLDDNYHLDLPEEEVESNNVLLSKDTYACVDLPIDLGIQTVCWFDDDDNEEFSDYPLMCSEHSTNNNRDMTSLSKTNDADVDCGNCESGMPFLSNYHEMADAVSNDGTVVMKGENRACDGDDAKYLAEATTTVGKGQMMVKEVVDEKKLRLPLAYLIRNDRSEMSADSDDEEKHHQPLVMEAAGEEEAPEASSVPSAPQHELLCISKSCSIHSDCFAALNNCIRQVAEGDCVTDIDQYHFFCADTVMCVDDGTEV